MDKQLAEDFEFAKRTEEAWKEIEEGNIFIFLGEIREVIEMKPMLKIHRGIR
jgi:hypothetical protein